jgi:hypothetical protein
MGENRNYFGILVGKPEAKRQFRRLLNAGKYFQN